MGVARIIRRNGLPLTLAVAASVAYGVVAVTVLLVARNTMALPGAAISLVAYGTFGYFALRGREWARWLMFTLLLLTTLTCTFFTFFSLGSGRAELRFTPVLGAFSVYFASAAIGMAVPRPKPAS